MSGDSLCRRTKTNYPMANKWSVPNPRLPFARDNGREQRRPFALPVLVWDVWCDAKYKLYMPIVKRGAESKNLASQLPVWTVLPADRLLPKSLCHRQHPKKQTSHRSLCHPPIWNHRSFVWVPLWNNPLLRHQQENPQGTSTCVATKNVHNPCSW